MTEGMARSKIIFKRAPQDTSQSQRDSEPLQWTWHTSPAAQPRTLHHICARDLAQPPEPAPPLGTQPPLTVTLIQGFSGMRKDFKPVLARAGPPPHFSHLFPQKIWRLLPGGSSLTRHLNLRMQTSTAKNKGRALSQ